MITSTLHKTAKLSLLAILFLVSGVQSAFAQVDFREETIYFLMTTRFFDGDPSNNRPNEWASYNPDPNINPGITDPNDVTWRGDFKGLIEKLDYIKDLGFTAIWITPIVQNWSPLDYHGYHAYDFTKVDPRLESPGATFQDVIDEIHARDMKIVLDIVTNHTGRYGIKGHAEIKYNTDPTKPWGQDKNGNPLQPNPNWEYDGMTPNPDDGKIWSRANLPPMPAPFNENLAAYNWPGKENYVDTSDPDWFHHSGNGFAQGYDDLENLYNRALAGDTPDLNTSSPKVREYLVNAYKTFIEMGVDAFRWDTIKHMSKEDVLYFLDEFKKINPNLFVFGEVAQKRHELHNEEKINPHWYTWRGAVGNSENSGMAVIDFFAMSTFHLFNVGGGMSGVTAAARYDHLYADPSTNILFLDNHDFGPNNDWNQRFGGNDENLAAVLSFMFTWRGIPQVYYGTEMRFKAGAYNDIKSEHETRQSIDNTGRAYYGDVMDQAPNHRIYKHIKKLNAIRKAVPALQKGSWSWGGNGGGNGVGYTREFGDSYAVVGIAKDGAVNFSFSGIKNGTYRDAVTGHEVVVSNGSLNFTVAPSSAGIYVLNGPGLVGELGVGFFQSDANGTQGTGGGGGSQDPAELGVTPANPKPGEQVTITYDGFLNDKTQVNMYWGYDGWSGVSTTAMTKSGEIWTVTVTVPSAAKTKLNLVFNDGSGTWDNNNSSDYEITLGESSGTGGGTATTITAVPAQPASGEVVSIIYDGVLNSQSQVNMYWGYDGWKGIQTSAMTKAGEKWTVSVTVPATAVTRLNMAFNNGNGTWDNNEGKDYTVELGSSNGGGTGGNNIVSWTPASPNKDDVITITVNKTEQIRLHWGVNGWSAPDQAYQPAGSVSASGAIQTPLNLVDGKRVLQLGPFNGSQDVTAINFVLYYPDSNTWDNNNSADYRIDITQATSSEYQEVASSYQLFQNYPNPFNPSTRITFELPQATVARLIVTDLLGRVVAEPLNGPVGQGIHVVNFDASRLSSGMYVYRLETSMGVITRKMTLLK